MMKKYLYLTQYRSKGSINNSERPKTKESRILKRQSNHSLGKQRTIDYDNQLSKLKQQLKMLQNENYQLFRTSKILSEENERNQGRKYSGVQNRKKKKEIKGLNFKQMNLLIRRTKNELMRTVEEQEALRISVEQQRKTIQTLTNYLEKIGIMDVQTYSWRKLIKY